MNDHASDGLANSTDERAAVATPAKPDVTAMAGKDAQPTIRYATDAEVDAAMTKIFQQHDRLFAELAK